MKFVRDYFSLLPYEKKEYISYLSDEPSHANWNGCSFQFFENDKFLIENRTHLLYQAFDLVLAAFDINAHWIVSHDDKDLKWFPKKNENLLLLKNIFIDNKIEEDFVGAIIATTFELMNFLPDLLLYPVLLSYKNIDISNSNIPFILKITNHQTLDILTTDPKILNKYMDNEFMNCFNKVRYR